MALVTGSTTSPSGQTIYVGGATAADVSSAIASAAKGGSGNSTSPNQTVATPATSTGTSGTTAPTTAKLPNQPTQPETYTIAPGDTLSTIAQKYGTNIQAIMGANPTIENANKISAGSQIQIPGSNPPPATSALGTAANTIYGAVSGVPDQSNTAAVTSAAGAALNPTPAATDPVTAAIQPIISQLTGYVNELTSPSSTNTSLQDEYSSLMANSGLTGVNTQMMNLQNVMNGTTDDIRSEVTQANGFATESQIQSMSTARNNVLLKQYNSLATVQASLTSQIQTQMQFSEEDQSNALTRINDAAGITETMSSLQQSIITNAQKQYDSVVTQVGYTGLASIVAGNPYQQSLAEESLGLPQGTLSDPDLVSQLQTMKQQQLAQGQQRIVIQDYNAGLTPGGTTPAPASGTTPAPAGTTPPAAGSSGSTTAPPASTYSAAQMTTALANAKAKGVATSVGADHSVVIGGTTYTSDGKGNFMPQQPAAAATTTAPKSTPTDDAYSALSSAASSAPAFTGSPLNTRRWSMAATAAVKNYINLPIFQTLSGSSQYLAKIEAAEKKPGSISDTDLLDSYVKLSTGQGQVTDSQVNTILKGQSISDYVNTVQNKLANGGVLSTNQRQDLEQLSQQVYSNYQELYKPVYTAAVSAMKQQGIPPAFWSMMPDLSSLSSLGTIEAQAAGTEDSSQ